MNLDLPQHQREELEAKVTAMLLGELNAGEAETLRKLIDVDEGLRKWHDQLKLTLGYVGEAVAESVKQVPLKLDDERREKLLAQFKTIPLKQPELPQRDYSAWFGVAAVAAIVLLLVAISVPNFVRARTTSTQNAIINNLRLFDSAKQQWALEKGKTSTDVPEASDLKPYMGRGSAGEMPGSIAGESFIIGSVGQAPVAQMPDGKKIVLPGRENEGSLGGGRAVDQSAAEQAGVSASVPPPAFVGSPQDTPTITVTGFTKSGPATRVIVALPPKSASDEIAQITPSVSEGQSLEKNKDDIAGLNNNGATQTTFDGRLSAGQSSPSIAPALPPPTLLNQIPAPVALAEPTAPEIHFETMPVPPLSMRTGKLIADSEQTKPTGGISGGGGGGSAATANRSAGNLFYGMRQAAKANSPSENIRSAEGDLTLNPSNKDADMAINRRVNLGLSADREDAFKLRGDSGLLKANVTNSLITAPVSSNVYSMNGVGYLFASTNNLMRSPGQMAQLDKTEKKLQDNYDAGVKLPKLPPVAVQPEFNTRETNFSTFSLNVSDVSFKLAEASLQNGALPDAGSIRSEEFINAFDYRDPEPAAGAPINFAWERAGDSFAHNRDFLRFSVKTAAEGRDGRPLNLVLVLDKSGSMERADRVEIVRQALRTLASQLTERDTLSVVVFARTARLWVDGAPGNKAGEVGDSLSSVTPEGGTNIEEAMKLGYKTSLSHYLANGENRVVFLTDGAANLGNVDAEALKKSVEANRKQGISLDCFGIGWDGYNDEMMETLSRNGGGRYGFINTPEEAATDFAGQLAGALHVAACDVKVQVEFNTNRVTTFRQIGYAKHQLAKQDFRDNIVKAAQIGAAESGNALYTVEINPAGEGPVCTVRARFRTPGTSDYHEREWVVPYTGAAPALDKAAPSMRLAAVAAEFSEWLGENPYAVEVTPDKLLNDLTGIPAAYGADTRPQKLESMIRQAKSITGK